MCLHRSGVYSARVSTPPAAQHSESDGRCGYRCVLTVPLPSWPHCNDSLSVWRRVATCTVSLRTFSSSDHDVPATPPSPAGTAGAVAPRRSARRSAAGAAARGAAAAGAAAPPPAPPAHGARAAAAPAAAGAESASDDDASAGELEFVCDARAYARTGLARGEVPDGSAVPVLAHLLEVERPACS